MRFKDTLLLCLVLLPAGVATAYPEFQTFVERHSGRNVNCALCHTHPDGPEGLKPGQIGSLEPAEMDALNRARAAFTPGAEVDSPILNEFGESIIEQLGKQQFLQIRQNPAALAEALNAEQDLDKDGLTDREEYLAGTLATDPNHGDPWQLFATNLARRWFDILMISLATAAGIYGLHNLLLGFEVMGRKSMPGESGDSSHV